LVLTGDDKNDVIMGPDGVTATVDGEAGDDTLTTNDGSDYLRGGAGRDTLDGGTGSDTFDGGDALDTVSYARRAVDQPVEDLDGAVGDDAGTKDGPPGARDTINANVENVTGGDGADLITGNAVANVLIGGAGVDRLLGLAGNDTIHGNAGRDRPRGGLARRRQARERLGIARRTASRSWIRT